MQVDLISFLHHIFTQLSLQFLLVLIDHLGEDLSDWFHFWKFRLIVLHYQLICFVIKSFQLLQVLEEPETGSLEWGGFSAETLGRFIRRVKIGSQYWGLLIKNHIILWQILSAYHILRRQSAVGACDRVLQRHLNLFQASLTESMAAS